MNLRLDRRPTLFSLLLLTLFHSLAVADAPGTALATKIYNRPNGSDSSTAATMILEEKGHAARKRSLYLYQKDKSANERWSLIRFTSPPDVDGTGLLTRDYPGDESDQWLYLPALDRVRRIASSRKGGRFVGSDLFYEDLRDREVDMDHHRLAGQGKVGGLVCDILVSTPVTRDNSVYSQRMSWIHPATLTPLRVDFFQHDAKTPSKRLLVKKIRKIQGYWTVLDSTMYDLESGHRTQIIIGAIKYDQGLPDSLFSQQALADESQEKRFRP